ncbi:MAG: GerAB/ArcD/ProY family transporter [Peptococcaceae bacterium]|jgi:spore germination protein KB|nr:GerAB/ArcD/ProY family transporter [Peptococcaceae bacterium]
MIESGKINSRQAIWLLITLVVATAGIHVPPLIVNIAGQDAWFSVIAATLAALLIAWLIVGLALRFPGKNLFAIMELILGTIPGKIIAFVYVLWFIHLEIIVLSEFGHFHSFSLPDTPMAVNHIMAFIVITYMARHGLEIISRFNELFLPLFIFSVVVLSALSFMEMEATRLLPVFDCETADIMKGS